MNKIIVPNTLILSKIKTEALYLYIILRLNSKNNVVELYCKELMKKLNWLDNRSLKKHLQKLKDGGYIDYDFEKLPIRDRIKIIINNLDFNKREGQYTSIENFAINKIIECSKEVYFKDRYIDIINQSIKIYLVYKYFEKVNNENMAEISYDKIREVTGFNSSYIKLVNEHLRRTKLIYIKYGEFTENNMRDCNKYKTLSGNEYLKMPYKEYLQTEHWINLREQALRKAKYKCELCNSKENLNVHHKTYDNKGNEPLSDLIVLCNNCHAKFHNKVINLS